MILVTGGSGFIGTNFIYEYTKLYSEKVINLDLLTYAGNANNLKPLESSGKVINFEGNINDSKLVKDLLYQFKPSALFHFAAESHVDRSILGPSEFIKTNINGTFNLLMCSNEYIKDNNVKDFKFFHVSTDEVFGALSAIDPPFDENSQYSPNSPYSASKASSDFLVRSFCKTYNFPAVITNCSNNFGPFQSPDKLIPLTIFNAINNKPIPIYGNGKQIRDWLYVKDHVLALLAIMNKNSNIELNYCIGGDNEVENIKIVTTICNILDQLYPSKISSYSNLIKFVEDRPGHDFRYSVCTDKIKKAFNWKPSEHFNENIEATIKWYLNNTAWMIEMNQKLTNK
jgi:dTDP-glucose 4,6-dehydratase